MISQDEHQKVLKVMYKGAIRGLLKNRLSLSDKDPTAEGVLWGKEATKPGGDGDAFYPLF